MGKSSISEKWISPLSENCQILNKFKIQFKLKASSLIFKKVET